MIAALVLAALSYTPIYTFDPPAPHSQSYVFLRMRVTWPPCPPQVAKVTRSGNTFDVVFPEFTGGGCAGIVSQLDRRVPLGALEPGEYTVISRLPNRPPDTIRLSVADANASLTFSVPFVSTAGDTRLRIYANDTCVLDGPATVFIDDVSVPALGAQCAAVVTAPPHAAGAVDVEVRTASKSYLTRSTLRYVDPAAPPDPAVFQRVLLPVVFSGAGGFGSRWVTEGAVVNRSNVTRTVRGVELQPGQRVAISSLGSFPGGLILAIPRAWANALRFNTIVRDASHDEASWGTEVPVVREDDFRTSGIELPDVVIDPRYRTSIRLYGLDGVAETVSVFVSGNGRTAGANIDLQQGSAEQPAYAMVDLGAAFREPLPPGTYTVTIGSPASFHEFWAMASITNNTTQQVTLITPR